MRHGTSNNASAPYACEAFNAVSTLAMSLSTALRSVLLKLVQPRRTEWIFMPAFSANRQPFSASAGDTFHWFVSMPSKPACFQSAKVFSVGFPINAFCSFVFHGAASDVLPKTSPVPVTAAAAKNSRRLTEDCMVSIPCSIESSSRSVCDIRVSFVRIPLLCRAINAARRRRVGERACWRGGRESEGREGVRQDA